MENKEKQEGMFFGTEHKLIGGVYLLTNDLNDNAKEFALTDVLEVNGETYVILFPLEMLQDMGNAEEDGDALIQNMVIFKKEKDSDGIIGINDEEYHAFLAEFAKATTEKMVELGEETAPKDLN